LLLSLQYLMQPLLLLLYRLLLYPRLPLRAHRLLLYPQFSLLDTLLHMLVQLVQLVPTLV
jgi:hypothetical protein